jgi:hypothetical protein
MQPRRIWAALNARGYKLRRIRPVADRLSVGPHRQHGCAPLVRPRAIENVWNSYVLQLCVVNCLSRDRYDARCPRLLATRRLRLRFIRNRRYQQQRIEQIILTTQDPHNDILTSLISDLARHNIRSWQGACFIRRCNQLIQNKK